MLEGLGIKRQILEVPRNRLTSYLDVADKISGSAPKVQFQQHLKLKRSFNCRKTSCAEWCLSKGGGSCDQLFVNVRQNGTDVDYEGCQDVTEKICPVLDKSSAASRNCAKDHHCTSLDGMW